MAVRQYIGARYTIKIYENSQDAGSAEWEANTSYEPLVMVTFNNSSYLSKKDVPATIGNPAQNPLYWIVTGAYNGQIAALQAQIDAIENNELPAIQSDISSVQDNVNTLINTTIPSIGNEIDNLEASIVDVTSGPQVGSGSTDISDHDFHTIASVELPARGRYIMIFKADFQFPSSESGVIHSLEMEIDQNPTITQFGQGRATYIGREFTSNGNNTVASLVLPYQITPQSDLTFYLHVRDRSTGSSVKAYPWITSTNFA